MFFAIIDSHQPSRLCITLCLLVLTKLFLLNPFLIKEGRGLVNQLLDLVWGLVYKPSLFLLVPLPPV